MPGPLPTVTIIDDDESIRRALCRLIKSLGINVETFGAAEEFLQRSQPKADDLVRTRCLILDVHLPGMSGFELQKRMNAGAKNVPIVFITAYLDDQARDQALRAGAIAFLCKPFEEQVLLDAVQEALAQSRTINSCQP